MPTTKKTITHDDYLRLVGLLTLARDHNRMLKEIERSAARITGETDEHSDDYFGITSDAVVCDYTASDLLGRLGITVEAPAEKERT